MSEKRRNNLNNAATEESNIDNNKNLENQQETKKDEGYIGRCNGTCCGGCCSGSCGNH